MGEKRREVADELLIESARGGDELAFARLVERYQDAVFATIIAITRDFDGALRHFARGLEFETAPFSRGQLLLWASRTARALGKGTLAHEHRKALNQISHPLADELRDAPDDLVL